MSHNYNKVVIDFFSGLDGWTQAFDDSWLIISVELNDQLEFTHRSNQHRLISNILNTNLINHIDSILSHYNFKYVDLILASPPCQSFSIASCSTHWTPPPERLPKTEKALLGNRLVLKTFEIIDYFNPSYFIIENPRGLLRKMPFMLQYNHFRHTIWLCQYNDIRAKPTDLWSNLHFFGWTPRPLCKNYRFNDGEIINRHCHHESARRGAKTGTQGLKGNALRSKLPFDLSKDISSFVGGLIDARP